MRRFSILTTVFVSSLLVLAACSSGADTVTSQSDETQASGDPGVSSNPGPAGETDPYRVSERDVLPEDARPFVDGGFASQSGGSIRGFRTDLSRSTIHPREVMSGGPPKDGIPAIDRPVFESVAEAGSWLGPAEPVFVVSADGESHIYPVQILTYHEIVNDTVGSTPVSVTYCPLCNTGLTFRRGFADMVLDFGTTGRLRLSNLIMYDRQTETWWQQATGEGLVGRFAGFRLELYPMLMLPWERARDRYPDASVLSRDTGFARPYGNNPYAGYDTSARPFLYNGPRTPGPFTSMDRVVEVVEGKESAAIPYPVLESDKLVQRDIGGVSIVVFWESGTASALDSRSIANGRDVGSANAFYATVNGRTLTFEAADDWFMDMQTGSTWDGSGLAVSGELEGTRLEPAVGVQHFWFSHSAFAEDGRWTPLDQ